ncbi:MAG: hypothetical protein NTZ39_01190 [Methanoregula sp.]|nr:hypothetical protein [Methanoregula sp.]
MKYTTISFILIIICAMIAFAGCTGTPISPGTTTSLSTPVSGAGTPATGGSLVISPTDTMPDYSVVTVDVGEKDYLGVIPVIFQGGMGQVNVKQVNVKLTRTDGTTQTESLGLKKGDMVELVGTRGSGTLSGQPDRVEVWVITNSGQTYKIVDKLIEYRTRG